MRDVAHFRGHGIRISRWKCSACDREVPSDRCTDLRDHVKRRHPDLSPESVIPIWGNVEVQGKGLSGTTRQSRADLKNRQPETGQSARRRTPEVAPRTPEPATRTPEPAVQSPEPAAEGAASVSRASSPSTVDIVIGDPEGEASFLTVSSVSTPRRSPRKQPKESLRRVVRRTPSPRQAPKVKGRSRPRQRESKTSSSSPATKRARSTPRTVVVGKPTVTPRGTSAPPSREISVSRQDVVTFLSTIPREEWAAIQAEVRQQREGQGERGSPSKAVQTRNLERMGVNPAPGPSTADSASQTLRQTPNVSRLEDGELQVSFPCGSTLGIRAPTWLPPAPP